jgi:peptidoglycan/LPS O-acetylase OafA/YrhL
MAPWCRISPYAIGLLTGFLVINTGRTYHLNRNLRVIGNITAIILALTCIFSNYGDFILPTRLSHASIIAYQALSRPAWSISVGWIIFLCSINQAGIVNDILSSAWWLPLARLNYATYLIHITVIFITVFNQSNPLYYQFMSCTISFLAQLFFSYLAAIIIVIFFETPFFILEKKLFKRSS